MSLRLQKNAKITLSILFIIIGIILITFNYFGGIKSNLFNEKNIELFEQNIVLPEELETVDTDPDVPEQEPTVTPSTDGYIGYLSVPDVNIKRGFTSLDSPYNSLKYNVLLVQGSTMPDVDKGNLILAAHNGHSKVSFFNDLYKLNDGAHAYVTYNGKLYNYVLKTRYDVPKVGTITVKRDASKTTLTLITCHRTDNHLQVVFVFELESINNAG
ncbi:MAG: sortase [Bacilli bacterium]|nr:sortase [Bacilli bacterium]